MLERTIKPLVIDLLSQSPAVALLGPRQVGKTTLAIEFTKHNDAIYLDLESPRDLAKLSDIEAYCAMHPDRLIILDEVQRLPGLFSPLRSIIDRRRREGFLSGQFLLLGSASITLLQQSSESLAGRIAFAEMTPLGLSEVHNLKPLNQLYLRGGFPDSLNARSDAQSLRWRESFISTYLERDIPQLGPRIPAETLRRFWTMLAYNQGELFNASSLARGLDLSSVTIARYLDLLVDLLLVRRLQPWQSNLGRRMTKAPKVFIRDSGLCHALLGIETMDNLLGHPVLGGSWESFVVEQILNTLPNRANVGFYRTNAGAEIDLIWEQNANTLWAIEVKRSSAPSLTKGFHSACEDLQPNRKIVVYDGDEVYPLGHGITAMPLPDFLEEIRNSLH